MTETPSQINPHRDRDYFYDPPNDLKFIEIVVRAKSEADNDWRSYIRFGSKETMQVFEVRGYGSSPGRAAENAWKRYKDPELRFFEFSVEPWE